MEEDLDKYFIELNSPPDFGAQDDGEGEMDDVNEVFVCVSYALTRAR